MAWDSGGAVNVPEFDLGRWWSAGLFTLESFTDLCAYHYVLFCTNAILRLTKKFKK